MPLTYREISDIRKTVCNLKIVWDMVALVRYQFDVWKETLWLAIDTDTMEQDGKAYLKQRDVQMPIDAARAAHARAAAAISAAMGVLTTPASHAALAKSAARKVPVRRPGALLFKR